MRECLRRFDEDMCEKASKAALIELRESRERKFIYRDDYEELTNKTNKIQTRMNEV